MGLTFRKSIRVGRFLRLNLSGSGVGASAGARGARVGVSARGRAYVDAGGGGLRYRATLGAKRHSAAVESTRASSRHSLLVLALLVFLAFQR
ncbi:MAG: DUF4236 domain-containing protein [Polyangiaceae bacterium]